MVALIGLGELPGFSAAKDFVKIEKRYNPNPENAKIYDKLFADYKMYIIRSNKHIKQQTASVSRRHKNGKNL